MPDHGPFDYGRIFELRLPAPGLQVRAAKSSACYSSAITPANVVGPVLTSANAAALLAVAI